MNFFSPSSSPIFLAPVVPPGPVIIPVYPSQIKCFDVYYTYEPAVGIHIIGSDGQTAPVSLEAVVNLGTIPLISLQAEVNIGVIPPVSLQAEVNLGEVAALSLQAEAMDDGIVTINLQVTNE